LRLLADQARDLPPRQWTLLGAISWSYDLLNPREHLSSSAAGGSALHPRYFASGNAAGTFTKAARGSKKRWPAPTAPRRATSGSLERLAWGLVANTQFEPAAWLFGASETQHALLGIELRHDEQVDHAHLVTVSRDHLGDAFAIAWSAGQSSTVDEAVALALEITRPSSSLPDSGSTTVNRMPRSARSLRIPSSIPKSVHSGSTRATATLLAAGVGVASAMRQRSRRVAGRDLTSSGVGELDGEVAGAGKVE
jgi:hypothetical protein